MPLPLTVSCSSKIQIGFTFLVPAHPGSPGKEAVKWLLLVNNSDSMKLLPPDTVDSVNPQDKRGHIGAALMSSGVATNFFPGGAKFGDLGTEFPQWGPGAKHPEADDCIIIMCRILTTNNFNYFMQIVEQ